VKQPTTAIERLKVAQTACKALKLSMPCLLDDMKNSVGDKYSGWPDRLFVVGHDGKIAYSGGRGPRGFDPSAWEQGIKKAIKKAPRPPATPQAKADAKAGDKAGDKADTKSDGDTKK
jgi:hypothetical protein